MAELTGDTPAEVPAAGRQGPGTAEQAARWGVVVFLLLALVALAFGAGYVTYDLTSDEPATALAGRSDATAGEDLLGADILSEILQLLETYYVDRDSIDPEVLRDGAIAGILNTLNDPHTSYISPDDMAMGALDLSASYEGIGASVTDRNGPVEIVAPFRDSPAEAAGILAGDIILEVDGERTDGWSDQEAVQRIRGLAGTEVVLTVQHLSGEVETISIVRGEIQIKSVFTEPNLEVIPGESGPDLVDRSGNLATDIAYVNIAQFHEKTPSELRDALEGIEDGGYTGLIVDVRGNPGGLLSATVETADEFLDEGTILIEVDSGGEQTSFRARSGGVATEIPIVVLQDQFSASGAEVLAAALRDNGRATIIGTRSFGKGTVNQLQLLSSCDDPTGCGGLYISIGRWLTPNGEQIEGLGVTPDMTVEMTRDDYIEVGDIQVFAAIDTLRGN